MDKMYSILRRIFFWVFVALFVLITPASIFYSLGYKFDIKTRSIVRTGAIDIKTLPAGAAIVLNGNMLRELTPHALQGLIPGKYSVAIQKSGFFPYNISCDVRQASIEKLDVVLIPKIEGAQRSESGLSVLNFFIVKSLLAQKIIAFTDKGIYLLDDSLKIKERIAPLPFGRGIAYSIKGIREGGDYTVFWNNKCVWRMKSSPEPSGEDTMPQTAYQAQDEIKELFFALKGRYLIIHDGDKVIALDVLTTKVHFDIFTLQDRHAKIYYDSQSELLYIDDTDPSTGGASLSEVSLTNVIPQQE